MMTKTRFLLPLGLAILASSGLARAESNGISGYSGDPGPPTGGASCDDCHGGGVVPTVDMAGPMTVTPGSTNRYTMTISGGQAAFGSLDVSATMGALAAFEAGTRLDAGEIVHSTPKAAVGGDVTFSFDWMAPLSPGTAALYGSGLSSDGRGTGGDGVDRIVLMISVESAPPANEPPVADAGGPYVGTIGVPIAFDGSGSFDPDGMITSFSWDFGDGSVGTGERPTHAYALAGAYTVSLSVTDDNGATDTKTTRADVNDAPPGNQPPIADPGGPYVAPVGTSVTFDGSGSRDPDGTITSYVWDFGDGSTGSGASVDHNYAMAGVYKVTLTVTDDQGASASDTVDAVMNDPSTSSLLILLKAPRRVKVRDDDREVKIAAAVDISSLPPGTTGCGTATLFKNDQTVGTESFCIEREDDDDGDDDHDDEDDDEDDDHHDKKSRRKMKVKTSHGVVAMPRPTKGTWSNVNFEVRLTTTDAPSVVWTAQVELLGRTGESSPVTTRVGTR